MSETHPAKPRSRVLPRFSLRSLLLLVLTLGSGGGLWMHWEPWLVERNLEANVPCVERVLFLPNNLFVSYAPGCMRVWKADTFELVHDLKTDSELKGSLWNIPGSSRLVLLTADGAVDEWDPVAGKRERQLAKPFPSMLPPDDSRSQLWYYQIAWCANGRLAHIRATCGTHSMGFERLIDVSTGENLFERQQYFDKTFPFTAVAPDGRYVAYFDQGTIGSLVLKDVANEHIIWSRCDRLPANPEVLAFSKDGKTLCVYSYTPSAAKVFFGVPEGEGVPFSPPPFESDYPRSADGKYYVDTGMNQLNPGLRYYNPSRSPQLRNLATGDRAVYLAHWTSEIEDYAFAPDGRLAAAKADGTVDIWRYRRPEQWWGLAWLPEFWLTVVFGIALIWSLRRDWKTLRARKVEAKAVEMTSMASGA